MPDSPLDLSNPEFGTRNYATAGLPDAPPPGGTAAANPNLGKRDQTGLQNAFTTSPILNGRYNLEMAGQTFSAYTGENTDFPMYRRDFEPTGDSRPEYQLVRDKEGVDIDRAKLGTAFSPTTASPGAGNGFEYAALASGEAVRGLVPARAGETAVNPSDASYQNRGADPASTPGTVRTFKLGVGSTVGENRVNPPR